MLENSFICIEVDNLETYLQSFLYKDRDHLRINIIMCQFTSLHFCIFSCLLGYVSMKR